MVRIYFEEAHTRLELDAAQSLRYEVFAERLGIPILNDPFVRRDVSRFDNLSTSHHVLVYAECRLVGTARLALSNPNVASASRTRFGFEMEDEFVLDGFSGSATVLGEIARVCVHPAWQASLAIVRLYEGLYVLSRRLGVTDWLGAVDCQSSSEARAKAMARLLEERGLSCTGHRVVPRAMPPASGRFVAVPPRRSTFGAGVPRRSGGGEREPELATTISAFVRRLRARSLGMPARHPAFPGRYVLPMLVNLDALPKQTLARFDRRSLAAPTVTRRAC